MSKNGKDGYFDNLAKRTIRSSHYLVNKYGSDALLDQNVRRKDLHASYLTKAAGWELQNLLYNDTKNRGMNKYEVKDGKITLVGVDPSKPNFLIRLKRMLTDKPRNFIAHVAARLRGIYRKWLLKANNEKDQGKLKWYKNILRLILKGIDFVLSKLEGVHVNYTKRMLKDFRKKNPDLKNISDKDAMKYYIDPQLHLSNQGYFSKKLTSFIGNKVSRGEMDRTIKSKEEQLNSFIKGGNMYDMLDSFKDSNKYFLKDKETRDSMKSSVKDVDKSELLQGLLMDQSEQSASFYILRLLNKYKKHPHLIKNISKQDMENIADVSGIRIKDGEDLEDGKKKLAKMVNNFDTKKYNEFLKKLHSGHYDNKSDDANKDIEEIVNKYKEGAN